MNNQSQFPPDHLFTRLIDEAAAADAARLAEAKQRARQQEQEAADDKARLLDDLATCLGAEFMAAIQPYWSDFSTQQPGQLRIVLEIPQHNAIIIEYYRTSGAYVQTYGKSREHIRLDRLLPFTDTLVRARDQYDLDAAEIAHQEAINAAQEQYEAEKARVQAANRTALEKLQADYNDGEFDLYTLEYGIITEGGEVGREAVMVLHEEPDDHDRWLVVDYHGKQSREKFFYPVSLTGPDSYRATGRYYTRQVIVDGYGVVGQLSPTASNERVAAYAKRAAAALLPLPAMPDILRGLDI